MKLRKIGILARAVFRRTWGLCLTARTRSTLKSEYRRKGLDREDDSFALYRIIGNDLYPRHALGQSRRNLRFILENEPPLTNCTKHWIVNRIFDAEEEGRIIALLEEFGQDYIRVPFRFEDYAAADFDVESFPHPDFLYSEDYEALDEDLKLRALAQLYRHKNNYAMNNNGARNLALAHGRDKAKWILPWDGNCFLTTGAWTEIVQGVTGKPHFKYFTVPMARLGDNAEVLGDGFRPPANEEPQILFRRDAREEFDAAQPYGRRPKIILFRRLGIPGPWTRWRNHPWDLPVPPLSPETGASSSAGWVARLFSGQANLEEDSKTARRGRGLVRIEAIVRTLQYLDLQVMGRAGFHPDSLMIYDPSRLDALDRQGSGDAPFRQELLRQADAAMQRPSSSLATDATLLALAWHVEGESSYREAARDLIRTRLLSQPATAEVMSWTGLHHFLDALRLLRLEGEDATALKDWLRRRLEHLLQGEEGRTACRTRNHRGTWYEVQVAAIAAFLDERESLWACFGRARARLAIQIAPDGAQPHEVQRPDSMHACALNLHGWLNLVRIASKGGYALWSGGETESLGMAFAWLTAQKNRPGFAPDTEAFDSDRLAPLAHAARVFGAPDGKEDMHLDERLSGQRMVFPATTGIEPFWPLARFRESSHGRRQL